MSFRPLVLFSGLTVADYLLWNWSLSGNHDVVALVSGLSLPPLCVACVWLLVMSVGRLLASSRPKDRRARAARARRRASAAQPVAGQSVAITDAQAASAQASANARRLAA